MVGVPLPFRERRLLATLVSCPTNLAAEGTPDTVARSISGHCTANVHDRYQITREAAKKAALAAMKARVVEQVRAS
jgi:hypothetical protein